MALIAAAAWLMWKPGGASAPRASWPEARLPVSVILISIDTLRADHLSAYGYRKIPTPHIDSFADGGTIFTEADSQIPLTLPSHTSLFTSTYPFLNRIEENGEHVPPSAVTLAALLRARGYKTAAFIGGYFLDKRYGLDLGFDVYDSPFEFPGGAPPSALALRRDGALVARAAREWLATDQGGPVFLFLHLFDLHLPYDRGPRPGVSGYDAELEYEDRVLGGFRQMLEARGWWQRSLVVLLSDHGESLGDHGEKTHGYFVYQSTMHVPLIFHWPAGAPAARAKVTRPVGLIDVAPTILDLVGCPAPASFEGRSLLGVIESQSESGPAPIYGESLYAHDAFRWAPLRSLWTGKYQYISAPRAELYDLQKDPQEKVNILGTHRAEGQVLEDELGKLMARYTPARPPGPKGISPQDVALMESLGYVAAGPAPGGASVEPDPKDRLFEYRLYQRALLSLQTGRLAVAIPTFREILGQDPQNILARFHLGESYLAARRPYDALREWRAALALDPEYTPAAEAIGEFWLEHGDAARARARFMQVLAAAPNNVAAEFHLGLAEERMGMLTDALAHIQAACRPTPASALCREKLRALREKAK